MRYRPDRAEITRRGILASATELFRQHGVNEVSLSRIMAEIGLTPGYPDDRCGSDDPVARVP